MLLRELTSIHDAHSPTSGVGMSQDGFANLPPSVHCAQLEPNPPSLGRHPSPCLAAEASEESEAASPVTDATAPTPVPADSSAAAAIRKRPDSLRFIARTRTHESRGDAATGGGRGKQPPHRPTPPSLITPSLLTPLPMSDEQYLICFEGASRSAGEIASLVKRWQVSMPTPKS